MVEGKNKNFMVIGTVMSLKSALTPENMNFYLCIIHIKPFNPLTEKKQIQSLYTNFTTLARKTRKIHYKIANSIISSFDTINKT